MNLTRYFILLTFVVARVICNAQNLVPNPSFENISSQPCNIIGAYSDFSIYFQDWTIPTWGTADIFTSQSPSNCWVSSNHPSCSQTPRNGDIMIGLIPFSGNVYNSREYIQIQLNQQLIPGNSYYAEFFVSLAAKSSTAINKLGIYFSDTLISQQNSSLLNFTPQIHESQVILDSIYWFKISGTFTATSQSQYIIIGNFFDDTLTSSLPTNHISTYTKNYSYYYIDDVLVKETCLTHSPDTIICQNTSATLSVNSNNFIGWAESTNPSTILSTNGNLTVSPQQSTNYLIYSQCDTFDVWVYVQEPFSFNLGNDTTLCPNESISLSPNFSGDSYLWSDGSIDSTITVNSAGLYSLEITKNGCSSSDNIMINYFPEQIFTFDQDTAIFCLGDTLNFSFNLSNANFLWSDNSTANTVSITQTQNLGLTVEQNGCIYEDSILIYTPPIPQVNLGKDTTICEDELLVLNASQPYSTYLWQDGSTEAELKVNEAGTYWVNVENCVATSDTILIKTENCECVLFLPNSFTPDESGINDEFSAVTSCPVDYFQFIIYNRWGKVVFQSNNINEFWDGTVKNELTNTACFSYSLRYSFAGDAFVHTKFGHINMMY